MSGKKNALKPLELCTTSGEVTIVTREAAGNTYGDPLKPLQT